MLHYIIPAPNDLDQFLDYDFGKAVALCRKSTYKQARQFSFYAERQHIVEECHNSTMVIIASYFDVNKKGHNPYRTGLHRALLHAKRMRCVVVAREIERLYKPPMTLEYVKSFHVPIAVVIDPSLSDCELRSERIKYSLRLKKRL